MNAFAHMLQKQLSQYDATVYSKAAQAGYVWQDCAKAQHSECHKFSLIVPLTGFPFVVDNESGIVTEFTGKHGENMAERFFKYVSNLESVK